MARDKPKLPPDSFRPGDTLKLEVNLACGRQKLTAGLVTPPAIVALVRLDSGAAVPIGSRRLAFDAVGSTGTWTNRFDSAGLLIGRYRLEIRFPDGQTLAAAFELH